MNPTVDPRLRSFVPTDPEGDFPIQNLPYGVFRPRSGEPSRVGLAIGRMVLDLSALEKRGLFAGVGLGAGLKAGFDAGNVFGRGSLNALLSLGRPAWRAVRGVASRLLHVDEPRLRDDVGLRDEALIPMEQVEMCLPAEVGDYTDFYSSREHATNVGSMFRGRENALMPNWLHLPVAYHGRASSLVVSGTAVRRPQGQILPEGADSPIFGPTRLLDFELEVGFFVGPGNPLGRPIPISDAAEHIFGLVLVNDWSARDIQKWEYQPLGPFLAKNFATTISPWVVPLDALEPFRCAGPPQDPEPLPYLRSAGDWAFDIELEVGVQTARMESAGVPPHAITRSNFRYLYWNMCQQLAHHTVGGCNLRPGDLLASGTISGPDPGSYGSLLELTWGGKEPIAFPGGETRTFLQDGDTVILRGFCGGKGSRLPNPPGHRIGFGEARGTIRPG